MRSCLLVSMAAVVFACLPACESTEGVKPKKRPPLPGETDSELSWSRPTGPNDVQTPMGLPMSH